METKSNARKSDLTDEELADAYFIPQKLTKKQQADARVQLAEARKKSQAEMSVDDRLNLKLMQLKFQIEAYLKNEPYDNIRTFGYFLKEYLHILGVQNNEFAHEVDIHDTEVTNLIKDRRQPNERLMIRLELHSDKMFPAVLWHRLVEKRNEYLIQSNHQLRKDERKHVKRPSVKTGAIVLRAGARPAQKSTHGLKKEKAYQKAAKK
jgi:plasmid maintenance system antidote protein VapI